MENKAELMSVENDTLAHNRRVQLKQLWDAVRELMAPVEPQKKRSIGLVAPKEKPDKPKPLKER